MKLTLNRNNPLRIKLKHNMLKIIVFNQNYEKIHIDIHILNEKYENDDIISTYFFDDYTELKKSYDNTYIFSIPSELEYEKVFIFINEMNKTLWNSN